MLFFLVGLAAGGWAAVQFGPTVAERLEWPLWVAYIVVFLDAAYLANIPSNLRFLSSMSDFTSMILASLMFIILPLVLTALLLPSTGLIDTDRGPVLSTATPTPMVSPTPASEAQRFVVGNTSGAGVYLRRTPQANDRMRAWPDGTVMIGVGMDRTAEGIIWKNVRDPAGNVGWIPSQYLIESK